MKQLLLILILLLGFNLFSYEYLIYERVGNISNPSTAIQLIFYVDYNNYLRLKQVYFDDHISYNNTLFPTLNSIKFGLSDYYIEKTTFDGYYKNDLVFLNDLYLKTVNFNSFLNYLYNDNQFSATNYIDYTEYEILYNSDGLAVESVVNGVWAGLYDDNEKNQSKDLYDSVGNLKYYNGEPAQPIDSFYIWLAHFTHRIVGEVFQELSRTMIFGTIICIILVLAMLYFCIENFLFVPRKRSRPYYLYGEDGSRHTFRQAELEGKNYSRLNPEWARRRREENERARAGR